MVVKVILNKSFEISSFPEIFSKQSAAAGRARTRAAGGTWAASTSAAGDTSTSSVVAGRSTSSAAEDTPGARPRPGGL